MSLAKGKQNKYKYQQTEIIIHRPRKKQIARISDQKISTCSNVKCLGITLEANLSLNGIFNSIYSNQN